MNCERLNASLTDRWRRLITRASPAPTNRAARNCDRVEEEQAEDERHLAHRERVRAAADVEVDDRRLGRRRSEGDDQRSRPRRGVDAENGAWSSREGEQGERRGRQRHDDGEDPDAERPGSRRKDTRTRPAQRSVQPCQRAHLCRVCRARDPPPADGARPGATEHRAIRTVRRAVKRAPAETNPQVTRRRPVPIPEAPEAACYSPSVPDSPSPCRCPARPRRRGSQGRHARHPRLRRVDAHRGRRCALRSAPSSGRSSSRSCSSRRPMAAASSPSCASSRAPTASTLRVWPR